MTATNVLVVSGVGDDGIIQNTSVLLADQRQSSLSGLQGVNIADQNSLKELHAILSGPPT